MIYEGMGNKEIGRLHLSFTLDSLQLKCCVLKSYDLYPVYLFAVYSIIVCIYAEGKTNYFFYTFVIFNSL